MIVVANEPDEENRYREYESLYALPADAFDFELLSNDEGELVTREVVVTTPISLDYLQRSLRHNHNFELPDEVKPTANPTAYLHN